MNVEKFFSNLAFGKLANLSMAGSGEPNGDIEVAARPQVMHAVNEGLTRLYSRFVLKENDVIISLRDHITKYYLSSLYSEALYPQPGVEIPYILDTPAQPFSNDVIRIMSVYDSIGRKVPLNDDNNARSVFTPQFNMLQVMKPENGKLLNVVYQAKHPQLSVDHPQDLIQLPDVLHGALEAYTAYLVYSSINTQEAVAKAAEYMNLYEMLCSEVEMKDTVSNSTSITTTKFEERGWV